MEKLRPHFKPPLFLLLLPSVLLFTGWSVKKSPKTTLELLQVMTNHIQQSKVDEYTFIQETIRFDEAGNPTDTLIWYEAMQFPNRFRIDFGDLEKGNCVIFNRDSVFHIRGGEVKHAAAEVQELMLLEGGLTHNTPESSLAKLQHAGYNTQAFRADEYEGHPVWVIGGGKGDLKSKQVWIDQKKLTTRRRIDPGPDGKLTEVIFDDFQCEKGLWIETWVAFYRDGNLLQTERYQEIDVRPGLQEQLFEPSSHGDWHWKK